MRPPKLQTASQNKLPPPPDTLFLDEFSERTRFNEGRTHRYTLFRQWGEPENYIAFIGMNPSGADEVSLDRTVAKCERLARKWNWEGRPFGSFYMLNAFALRATNSDELKQSTDPVGTENDYWIRQIVQKARLVVAAWGKPGAAWGRGEALAKLLRETCEPKRVRCFAKNADGSPKHPLYQKECILAEELEFFF